MTFVNHYYINEVIKFSDTIYSGQRSRSSSLEKPRFDKSVLGSGNDQEGVGFYFTNNKGEAGQYAHPNGIIITANFKGNLIDKNTPLDSDKAIELINMSPVLEDALQDWGFDPPYVTKEHAMEELQSSMINEDDTKDTFLQIWYDLYHRGGHDALFVDNMAKIGYDGLLIEKENGVRHIIVYDPDALEILNVEKYQK